jgi:uncharacterized protein YjbI with pentapeptide repeats
MEWLRRGLSSCDLDGCDLDGCDLDGCDQVGCDEDGCSEEDVECCGVNLYSQVRSSRNLNCALPGW